MCKVVCGVEPRTDNGGAIGLLILAFGFGSEAGLFVSERGRGRGRGGEGRGYASVRQGNCVVGKVR